MIKHAIRAWGKEKKSSGFVDVVLHIGAPKCGSSAIQRFCVTHREELKQLGYYYPEHSIDVNGVSGGHSQMAGALINGNTARARDKFQQWLSAAREEKACLLLSAEAFYGQHAALKEFCEGLTVKVVGFLRHPVDYLLGNHNQGIKRHMSTRRLGDLLPELLSRPTGHLVGLPLLAWADAFGDDNCRFIPYTPPSSGGHPAERQFMEALGVGQQASPLLESLEGQTNRSYVKSALELKRLLNTVLDGLPAKSAHQVDWSLQGYSDRAHEERGFTMSDLSADVRERLEAHLLEQMAPVVARFPELKSAAEAVGEQGDAIAAGWLNLTAPLAALRQDAPEVLEAIHARALVLRDQGRSDYTFCKLLDVLGIEFHEPEGDEALPGLTPRQRTLLGGDKAKDADILREMAVLLERQGLIEDALFAISRALERRPKGPGIQKIKARIEAKHQVRQAESGTVLEQDGEDAGR